MKFFDLDPDSKHQILVMCEAYRIACTALTDPIFYSHMLTLFPGNTSATPKNWATLFGEVAVENIKEMPEEYKERTFKALDRATKHASESGKSFLLVIEE